MAFNSAETRFLLVYKGDFAYILCMQNDLKSLSKSELINQLVSMKQALKGHQQLERKLREHEGKLTASVHQIKTLREQLEQSEQQNRLYKRLIFGAKRERFVPDSRQIALPFEKTQAQKEQAEVEHNERIEYTRRKAVARKHPGRVRLPEHLPVEEVHLDPPGDLSGMQRIGELVTDKLEMIPAKVFIKRYIRGKYVVKGNPDAGVQVATLPDEGSDKSIAGPSVMAQVVSDKYCDHLPLYRQQQRFRRHGISIASSTIGSWEQTAGDRL